MSHIRKRGLCWLLGAVMTAALMAFVLLCTEVKYAVNDDSAILRAFLGYETGAPAHFHIYIHGLLAWPLCWLSTAFPGLPWFTYLQLALLTLSCLVLSKSVMQCFVKHEKPLWLGAVFAAALLLTLCLKYIVCLTFTQTAAMLGAAAVLQMFSIEHDRGGGRVVVGMAGALALVALAYALRQTAALPLLAMCGLTFVMLFVEHYGFGRHAKRPARPMVVSLVLVAAVMAGLVGARALEIRQNDVEDYLAWQEANTDVIDYYGIANLPQEAKELVGWDDTTVALAKSWCFLDPQLSTEAFLTLNDYMQARDTSTLADHIQKGLDTLDFIYQTYPADMRCLALILLIALFCLIGACVSKRARPALAVLCVLLLSAVMLAYLAITGRLPLRAALCVLLPAAAALFGLLPASLPRKSSALLMVFAALCVAHTALCLAEIAPSMLRSEEDEFSSAHVMDTLEEYALEEPESLFIFDGTLIDVDLRAFPDYSAGVPHNVTFWGGWGMRSPESRQLFERFGIDLDAFEPETFLRDDVFLVSGRIDPGPTLLLNWLQERLDMEVDWEIWSEYDNIYVLHFYAF